MNHTYTEGYNMDSWTPLWLTPILAHFIWPLIYMVLRKIYTASHGSFSSKLCKKALIFSVLYRSISAIFIPNFNFRKKWMAYSESAQNNYVQSCIFQQKQFFTQKIDMVAIRNLFLKFCPWCSRRKLVVENYFYWNIHDWT